MEDAVDQDEAPPFKRAFYRVLSSAVRGGVMDHHLENADPFDDVKSDVSGGGHGRDYSPIRIRRGRFGNRGR